MIYGNYTVPEIWYSNFALDTVFQIFNTHKWLDIGSEVKYVVWKKRIVTCELKIWYKKSAKEKESKERGIDSSRIAEKTKNSAFSQGI